MRSSNPFFAIALLAGSAAAATGDAPGWAHEAPIHVRVEHHEFHRVRAESSGCLLRFDLRLLAPDEGYTDARNPGRNQFTFRATVRFVNGHTVTSGPFVNTVPGERRYRFEHDTTKEGCFARDKTTVEKVDVVGCRGRGCSLEG